ncbi:TonB-dependent receptor [uncultured Cohaesibacter sp.]|uniref:TonB-dependent receptor n=1 Tax=uncultured Cohaesibacter sp. TaxID=1002546 RepID=UPI0029C67770|nr:TonB-dependent receptor [uncultured Cohaesibacter sp.]
MASNMLRSLLGSASILVLSLSVSSGTMAQEAETTTSGTGSDESFWLGEIIVTGERVVRSLFDTASSVEVLTASELDEKVEDQSVRETINSIPNVHYASQAGLNGAPTIRGNASEGPNNGSGAYFAGTVPRATINVDGRNLTYNEMVFGSTSVWDVDSIEVFRGPQTTSKGANSIAGAINVKTKDPVFDKEAALQLQYGTNNKWRTSAMANGVILEDQLAARVTGDFFSRDSFVDFTSNTWDEMKKTTSGRDVRLKLLWTPDSMPELDAKLTLSHSASVGPHNEGVTPEYEDLVNNDSTAVEWDNETNAAVLDINYQVSEAFSLFNQTQISTTDSDRNTNPGLTGQASIDQIDLSNESRLTYEAEDGRLSGILGVFARRTDQDDELYLASGAYYSAFDDVKDSLGVYSEMTYKLTDRLSATGGLRLQYDNIKREGTANTAVTGAVVVDYDENFVELLPKVSLAYKLTDNLTVGGLVSRGYNPGGISFGMYSGEVIPFEKETVWNYELFARASLLDDRLSLTGNLFYDDYSNAQRAVLRNVNWTWGANTYTSPEAVTYTAEEAETYGAELSARFEVFDNFTVNGSLGLLQTEIKKFNNSSANVDLTGKKFAKSPEVTAGIGASWEVIDGLVFAADANYVGGYYSDDDNTVAYEIDPFVVANVKASYQVNETLKVFAAVNNVFDDRSATYIMSNRTGTTTLANINTPREFTAGLRLDF